MKQILTPLPCHPASTVIFLWPWIGPQSKFSLSLTFPSLLWAPKSLTWEGPSKEEVLIISAQNSCFQQRGIHPTHHMPVDAETRKCSPTFSFFWNFLAYGWSLLTHPLNPQQKSFEMKKLTKSREWETCSRSHLASGVAWITSQCWTLPQLFLYCWHVIMHTDVW